MPRGRTAVRRRVGRLPRAPAHRRSLGRLRPAQAARQDDRQDLQVPEGRRDSREAMERTGAWGSARTDLTNTRRARRTRTTTDRPAISVGSLRSSFAWVSDRESASRDSATRVMTNSTRSSQRSLDRCVRRLYTIFRGADFQGNLPGSMLGRHTDAAWSAARREEHLGLLRSLRASGL